MLDLSVVWYGKGGSVLVGGGGARLGSWERGGDCNCHISHTDFAHETSTGSNHIIIRYNVTIAVIVLIARGTPRG